MWLPHYQLLQFKERIPTSLPRESYRLAPFYFHPRLDTLYIDWNFAAIFPLVLRALRVFPGCFLMQEIARGNIRSLALDRVAWDILCSHLSNRELYAALSRLEWCIFRKGYPMEEAIDRGTVFQFGDDWREISVLEDPEDDPEDDAEEEGSKRAYPEAWEVEFLVVSVAP
jgi:hypothetical protein